MRSAPCSCSCLGSPPVFQRLLRLRRLKFGGPALEELKRGDLTGITHLEELTVHANNLKRFRNCSDQWPSGATSLSGSFSLSKKKAYYQMFPPCCCRYEPGALAAIWPLGGVILSLHGPFLTDDTIASTMVGDVSYPETPMVLQDLNLNWNQSVHNLRVAARRRIRSEFSTVQMHLQEECPSRPPGGSWRVHRTLEG